MHMKGFTNALGTYISFDLMGNFINNVNLNLVNPLNRIEVCLLNMKEKIHMFSTFNTKVRDYCIYLCVYLLHALKIMCWFKQCDLLKL